MRATPLALAFIMGTAALSIARPATAFDITAMTPEERTVFQKEVHDYLVANPDVLVEVASALKAKQDNEQEASEKALIGANAAEIFADPASYVGGNPNGSLTLVEFIDYRCGYCRKAHSEVAELVKTDGDIRYVVKEFPILTEESVVAARFAVAALQVAGPEAYQKINAGFYESFRGDVTNDTLAAFATSLGLDPAPILAAMSTPEVDKVITANRALGDRLGISGTPSFVLGDKMLHGYIPLENMRQIVTETRG